MKKFFKFLQSILSGGILLHPKMRRIYPFFLLFAGIALLWITNTYYARSIQTEIADTKKKLEIAMETLKQEKTDYINKTQPAHLVKKLEKDSIKMAHNAINKIIADKKEGGAHE